MNETPDDPEADARLALLIRDSVAGRTLPADFAARVSAAVTRRRHRRVAALAALALAIGAVTSALAALRRGDGAWPVRRVVASQTAIPPDAAVGSAPIVGIITAARQRRRRDAAREAEMEDKDHE